MKSQIRCILLLRLLQMSFSILQDTSNTSLLIVFGQWRMLLYHFFLPIN